MEKLVRDKIPELLEKDGEKAKFRVAADEEYKEKLYEKLLEEFHEFKSDETIEEMADLLEVLHHIIELHQFNPNMITKVRSKKAEERGTFQKRIILERNSQ